ncbi:MAG TPA: fumarylacetoacetase, partial [Pyrinomonadaceae bacterium]|nr:fumarylacetoacetase [Pyrinomonadaceae bacterium]
MYEINETHDPNLKSWIESANDPNTDFPIQNLPIGQFETPHEFCVGVLIGDKVLDLTHCAEDDLFDWELLSGGARESRKNVASGMLRADFFSLDVLACNSNEFWKRLRQNLIQLLAETADDKIREGIGKHLIPVVDTFPVMPQSNIGDYTDFYCSIYHATNVGSMFRPDAPLLPNYKYVPIGYHGRASSIVISGTEIKRPHGQNRSEQEAPPVFIPAKNLDYEMELGFFVGQGNKQGTAIPIADAEKHIFGMCLVNDWSARDIQAWEYQPLGPFLAKNFATTISPFVVTMEALAPFRTSAFERADGDPEPLDYLSNEQNKKDGGLDITLEVYIQTERMRDENIEPHLLSRSNTKDLYWTVGQMLTHHASNGCNLQTGDLIASGTVSGKEKSERGCLLELTCR